MKVLYSPRRISFKRAACEGRAPKNEYRLSANKEICHFNDEVNNFIVITDDPFSKGVLGPAPSIHHLLHNETLVFQCRPYWVSVAGGQAEEISAFGGALGRHPDIDNISTLIVDDLNCFV